MTIPHAVDGAAGVEGSRRTQFYLFGYPISHSASPAFHNCLFAASGLPNHYQLHDTVHPENIDTDVRSEMLEILRQDTFGGCSVTMPLKVMITRYLDRLDPAASEIGSVNTIYLERDGEGALRLAGENTDWFGVRNALVEALPAAQRVSPRPFGDGKAGFIIGGGGTTRAAVYALSQLGLSPIYILNRDPVEVADIIAAFPQYDLRPLTAPVIPTIAESIAAGVGAIPCLPPQTEAERAVYDIAGQLLANGPRGRPFLEMCYKPRRTRLYEMAESAGWTAITGIEAMIEQGFAQQELWLLRSISRPWDRTDLPEHAKQKARALVRAMDDIVVSEKTDRS